MSGLIRGAAPLAFLLGALAAALAPLLAPPPSGAAALAAGFPGWPQQHDGQAIRALATSSREDAFARDFPGRIGRFTDGRREIIVRYVASPTRKLHPAADCFRGIGYAVSPLPMQRTAAGVMAGCFLARGRDGSFRVCEHIADGQGDSWPDVGAWYWQATLAGAGGPWWSFVVAERVGDAGERGAPEPRDAAAGLSPR